jgi:hypothetical protein
MRWFGRMRLRGISREEIQKYPRKRRAGTIFQEDFRHENERSRRPAPATLNTGIMLLRNLFNHHVRCGWLDRHPAGGIERGGGPSPSCMRGLSPKRGASSSVRTATRASA